MITKLIIALIASCLSGYFYHAGGLAKGKEDTWIPQFMRHSWVRDWICPLFSLIVLFTWWRPDTWQGYWLSIPSYILMAGALSTYWKKLFGKISYWVHGLFVGLSFFPFYWAGMHWWAIAASGVITCLLMGWLCDRTTKATKEELGRGFIAAATKIILKI